MKIPMLLSAAVVAAAAMIGCEGQNMHYNSTNSKPHSNEMQSSSNHNSDKQIAKAEKSKKGEYDVKAGKGEDDDDDEKEEGKGKKEGSSTKKSEEKKHKKSATTTASSKPAKSEKDDDDDDEEDDD